jgi:antitoxin VapB
VPWQTSSPLKPAQKMYIHTGIYTVTDMPKAKIFKSGNSQALRLPKEFRLSGKEVEIFRRGDEIVLKEKPRTMADAFALLADTEPFERRDTPPQRRKGLS